jgi:hypothetical protein
MARTLNAQDAARLAELAARRRADGSRGLGARWAWRQMVRACGAGDPAAQDAVRDAEPSDADVLDLLAVAPAAPADRAAYLTLIGQPAQHAALDPDGTLLALAYRAAPPDVRERLRTALAAEGDSEVIRVVVTGDRHDRIAELSYDELDYLSHQLAERQDWAGLRRLARDLPLASAAATAALLPPGERTGRLLTTLADQPADRLRALAERLPAKPLLTYGVTEVGRGGRLRASFSPDQSELALVRTMVSGPPRDREYRFEVSTVHVGTGDAAHLPGWTWRVGHSLDSDVFHLGDEVFVRSGRTGRPDHLVRVLPDNIVLDLPDFALSDMRRASGGAVMLGAAGLLFVDRGANKVRYQRIPRLGDTVGRAGATARVVTCGLATLPSAGLVAFSVGTVILVVDEDGTLRHTLTPCYKPGPDGRDRVRLSFSAPNSLAVHQRGHVRTWELPPQGDPRLVDARKAPSPGPPELDASAVERSPWGDMLVTMPGAPNVRLEVHSPHLPGARHLLEQPLAHSDPQRLRRIREVWSTIGDPEVRGALDVLHGCLEERFGGDIALGSTGSVAMGGPADIALGEDGSR